MANRVARRASSRAIDALERRMEANLAALGVPEQFKTAVLDMAVNELPAALNGDPDIRRAWRRIKAREARS